MLWAPFVLTDRGDEAQHQSSPNDPKSSEKCVFVVFKMVYVKGYFLIHLIILLAKCPSIHIFINVWCGIIFFFKKNISLSKSKKARQTFNLRYQLNILIYFLFILLCLWQILVFFLSFHLFFFCSILSLYSFCVLQKAEEPTSNEGWWVWKDWDGP